MLIQCSLEDGKTMERIMLKEITTEDDAERLFYIIKALLDEGSLAIEVWRPISDDSQ